jgi:1-deoxy-D-xylulose-5-phosphate reductoisomerase
MSAHGRTVSILGVTGSVGRSTIEVILELRRNGAEIPVEAITAGANLEALAQACAVLKPRFAAIADESLLGQARDALAQFDVEVGAGAASLVEAASRPSDWVMSAIVGAAGLQPTLAAVRRGAMVALANKECLVCAGPLFLDAAKTGKATLLPVDSEHNAIFQVMTHPQRVEKITLTASGGPFRTASPQTMAAATPEQACAHPRWNMGRKISVDSATLMNKGLELIEACYLFDIKEEKVDILVHPESVVHSFVHYIDGSVLAQLAAPDMRVPISYALAWPDRARVSAARLDLASLGTLSFEAPDTAKFPSLHLCRESLSAGAGATTALNAANEVAVGAFLSGRIRFLDICRVVEEVMADDAGNAKSPSSFAEVAVIDRTARRTATEIADRLASA